MLAGTVIDDHKILSPLRPGAGGNVYVVENLTTNKKFVLKSTYLEEPGKNKFERFVEIWKSMSASSEFIVKFEKFFYRDSSAFVLMEFCEGGDLGSLIKKKKLEGTKFPESEVAKIVCDVFNGLREMHTRNVVHRDIKSANILISKDGVYKLADYNVLCVLDKEKNATLSVAGTLQYTAPEIFLNKEYSFLSDVYSVGAVLYEILALTPPFLGTDIPRILENKYTPLDPALGYSTGLVQLVTQLLSLEPSRRPSVSEVLALPLLSRVRVQGLEGKQYTQGASIVALQATVEALQATVAECVGKIRVLEARNAQIEALYVAPPDYTRPVVKKAYDSSTAGEFITEENGWIFGETYSNSAWVKFVVNDRDVSSGNGEGVVWMSNGHFSLFYPLHKGDRYKFSGGSYHVLIFYPSLKLTI